MHGSSRRATKLSRSWLMLDRRRYSIRSLRDYLQLDLTALRSLQDFEAARKKALSIGAKKFYLEAREHIPCIAIRKIVDGAMFSYRTSSENLLRSLSTPRSRRMPSTRYESVSESSGSYFDLCQTVRMSTSLEHRWRALLLPVA